MASFGGVYRLEVCVQMRGNVNKVFSGAVDVGG